MQETHTNYVSIMADFVTNKDVEMFHKQDVY